MIAITTEWYHPIESRFNLPMHLPRAKRNPAVWILQTQSQVIESPHDTHAAVACILGVTLGKQTKPSWMSRRPSNFQISIEIFS